MLVLSVANTSNGSAYKNNNTEKSDILELAKILLGSGCVDGKVLSYGNDKTLALSVFGRSFYIRNIDLDLKLGDILSISAKQDPITNIISLIFKRSQKLKNTVIDHGAVAGLGVWLNTGAIKKMPTASNQINYSGNGPYPIVINVDKELISDYLLNLLEDPLVKNPDLIKKIAFLLITDLPELSAILMELKKNNRTNRKLNSNCNVVVDHLDNIELSFTKEEIEHGLITESFAISELFLSSYLRRYSVDRKEVISIADKIYGIISNALAPLDEKLIINFNNIFNNNYYIVPFYHCIKESYKFFTLFTLKESRNKRVKKAFLLSNLSDQNVIVNIVLSDEAVTFFCEKEDIKLIKNIFLSPYTKINTKFLDKKEM